MSAFPVIGDGPSQWSPHTLKLAVALMGKNRHYHMHAVQRRHFNSTARLQEIIARTPGAVEEVQAQLPEGFSQKVADKVLGGLLQAAKTLEGMGAE